jgi:cell division protein FtsX
VPVLAERRRRDASVASVGLAVGLAIATIVVLLNDGGSGGRSTGAGSASAEVTSTTVDRGGDVIAFLEPSITPEQSAAIEQVLSDHPDVAHHEYWDHAASLWEARRLFRDNAEMTAKLEENPELVPPSYRVTLVRDDTRSAAQLIAVLDGATGVLDVVTG